jgi:hypothetical protein
MKRELIKGGLGDGRRDKLFDKRQLHMGVRVEMEHTSSPRIAREIARDHLTEFPQYYNYLANMERQMTKDCRGKPQR